MADETQGGIEQVRGVVPSSSTNGANGTSGETVREVYLRVTEAFPFAWSTYEFGRRGDEFAYKQRVGAAAGRDVGDVGWTGAELVAFRMHLPSKIRYHDAPSKQVERGNIVVWEQTLADRLAGVPLGIEVRVETQSILYRTLWLFGLMLVLVLGLFAVVITWVLRKGREREQAAAP